MLLSYGIIKFMSRIVGRLPDFFTMQSSCIKVCIHWARIQRKIESNCLDLSKFSEHYVI